VSVRAPEDLVARSSLSRREALATLGGALAMLAGSGCLSSSTEPPVVGDGRLTARPSSPSDRPTIGRSILPASLGVSGLLYVPRGYDPTKPGAAAVLCHGAGQEADELIDPLSPLAEERGMILLAVTSRASTWDLMGGRWGADLRAIDAALAWTFARCAVDAGRVGVIGFSDGATYALALGRVNGDFLRRVVAYSPGILFAVPGVGRPEFFVTHGTNDNVLAVDVTRDFIVPGLLREGYVVQYREFTGGHGVTAALMTETIDWFVRKA
jgi:phospholipase/carboxylesterase